MTLPRNRIPADRRILSVKPITREDLAILTERRAGIPYVQRLRDPHHRLARYVAAGFRQKELPAKTGFSQTRISILMKDPAFIQLVAEYREKVTESFVDSVEDYVELAYGNMMQAERTIAEHFEKAEEEGELIPIKTALAIRADSADRLGYGKRQTNTNVNVDFAAMLEKAIARSGKGPVLHQSGGPQAPNRPEQPQQLPVNSTVGPRPKPQLFSDEPIRRRA